MLSHTLFYLQVAGFYFIIRAFFGGFSAYHTHQRQSSIDYIATAVNVSYDVALADLQKMVENGYFPSAHIDTAGRMIVLPQAAPEPAAFVSSGSAAPVSAEPRVVARKNCGANNTVSGALGECEYCGSPLA